MRESAPLVGMRRQVTKASPNLLILICGSLTAFPPAEMETGVVHAVLMNSAALIVLEVPPAVESAQTTTGWLVLGLYSITGSEP